MATRKPSIIESVQAKNEQRNNKFKLLFRDQNTKYKTLSERKLHRIDSKIESLKIKKNYLQNLMPK